MMSHSKVCMSVSDPGARAGGGSYPTAAARRLCRAGSSPARTRSRRPWPWAPRAPAPRRSRRADGRWRSPRRSRRARLSQRVNWAGKIIANRLSSHRPPAWLRQLCCEGERSAPEPARRGPSQPAPPVLPHERRPGVTPRPTINARSAPIQDGSRRCGGIVTSAVPILKEAATPRSGAGYSVAPPSA